MCRALPGLVLLSRELIALEGYTLRFLPRNEPRVGSGLAIICRAFRGVHCGVAVSRFLASNWNCSRRNRLWCCTSAAFVFAHRGSSVKPVYIFRVLRPDHPSRSPLLDTVSSSSTARPRADSHPKRLALVALRRGGLSRYPFAAKLLGFSFDHGNAADCFVGQIPHTACNRGFDHFQAGEQ